MNGFANLGTTTIQLVSLSLLALSASAACFSAIFSLVAVKTNSRNTEARLFSDFKNRYNTEEMTVALRGLVSLLQNKNDNNFAERWVAGLSAGDSKALEIDGHRRHVSAYYTDLSYLFGANYISKRLVKLLLREKGISVFFRIVEPMERRLIPNLDVELYDRLRPLVPVHNREFAIYANNADAE